ncbi:LysR family transcriptional regulator [Pseudodonghicola flavimaris]|uniref:LysR family transcriptional regulator n=1 Tax=Pseudodonghicola flavimaris TaxID=3050036 RepID=A0ABT7F785_9RHOB|nr:LysR family transcriptional regulator [Pseudodonghicola flavimaris]MDK3020479.1 LysR family transcriptional regulator [Pseudodonghicola flavimaris]
MASKLETRIKFRHLRAVLAVHAHGSVAAAARELCVSPPAVSKSLAEASDILGAELFRRNGRHPVTTEAGELLVRYGRQVLADLGDLEAELTLLAQGSTGSVTIGTSTHQAKSFIAEASERLKLEQPRILIRMQDLEPLDILPQLRDGRIELAFGDFHHVARVGDVDGLKLFDSETVLVTSRDHPALALSDPDWAALTGYAWALPPHSHMMRTAFEALWASEQVPAPTNVFESSSLLSIPLTFDKMQLIGPAPRELAEEWRRMGLVGILPQPVWLGMNPQGLLWSRDLPQSPAVRAYLSICRRMLAEDRARETAAP